MPETAASPNRLTLPLRMSDIDTLGHLNQAVYHTLLEEGRVAALSHIVPSLHDFVLARVELDHRQEVRITDREVTVETLIVNVGRSSVRLENRVLRPDGSVAAEGIAVLVAWDPVSRGSRNLTDEERTVLEAARG